MLADGKWLSVVLYVVALYAEVVHSDTITEIHRGLHAPMRSQQRDGSSFTATFSSSSYIRLLYSILLAAAALRPRHFYCFFHPPSRAQPFPYQ